VDGKAQTHAINQILTDKKSVKMHLRSTLDAFTQHLGCI
jgi:hypothetical protein